MTCRHFFIYLWAMKKNNSSNFLNVGCTTWLEDIYSYIYEQWNTFFPLAISECWLYHMTYIHFHLFICNETFFFLALFWRLVVPHDFKTFIHIFMSSETHFPLHISEYWLYHMTYRYFSFIYKQLNFFLAIFWMLVVPHDLQTCIHIFMSSETLIFLQFSECWLYHMTCRHLLIYLWAVKHLFSCNFLNVGYFYLFINNEMLFFSRKFLDVGYTTWLKDIFLIFMSNDTQFFPCIFWELVVPRDLQTFYHIYKQLNSFVTKYVENNKDKSLCFYALRMFYFFTGAFVFILLRG